MVKASLMMTGITRYKDGGPPRAGQFFYFYFYFLFFIFWGGGGVVGVGVGLKSLT
jgi:hypothetical protein